MYLLFSKVESSNSFLDMTFGQVPIGLRLSSLCPGVVGLGLTRFGTLSTSGAVYRSRGPNLNSVPVGCR